MGAGQRVWDLGGWVLLNYSVGITADRKFSYLSAFFASGRCGAEAPGSSSHDSERGRKFRALAEVMRSRS